AHVKLALVDRRLASVPPPHAVLQREGGEAGANRVILERLWSAERSHDRVAERMAVDVAAVALGGGLHDAHDRRQDGLDLLGIAALNQFGRTLDVGEEERGAPG